MVSELKQRAKKGMFTPLIQVPEMKRKPTVALQNRFDLAAVNP